MARLHLHPILLCRLMRPVRRLRTVLSAELITALALLVVGGPVLVFPDLLPAASRTSVVTALTLVALGVALLMLHPWKKLRVGLWLFLLAVVASWASMPVHDLLGLRHFAGIGVGILAMAILATWCTTPDRLLSAGFLFALGSIAVLITGLLGTSVNVGKFIGVLRELPEPLVTWLPEIWLGLPGIDEIDGTGYVNSNALAGTALLLVPTCCAVAIAAASRRCHRLTMAAAIGAAFVGLLVLTITRSRTALTAALVTLAVLTIHWFWDRKRLLVALLVLAAGLAYWVATFGGETNLLRDSALTRVEIWKRGMDRLVEAPWLGIGINQFHDLPFLANQGTPYRVAHVHNILLQVALDVGLVGLSGYVIFHLTLLFDANRLAPQRDVAGRIAAGAGVSLLGVHLFGIADAIALGAKVGLFQWLCAGLILAASRLQSPVDEHNPTGSAPGIARFS